MVKKLKMKNKHLSVKKIVIIVLLVLMLCITAVYFFFRVEKIEYMGNVHYTDEEMTDYIFKIEHPNAIYYKFFMKKNVDIPFVQKYDVDIILPNKMTVTVYEKKVVGYIDYMGSYMYFDKDGIIVESTDKKYNDVPQIAGLPYKSIVLNSKLDIGNEQIFSNLLEITQAFKKYDLVVDKIYFDKNYDVSVFIGNVRVVFGNPSDCADKIYVLKQLSSQVEGMKGTIHMENYDGTTESIYFKKEN